MKNIQVTLSKKADADLISFFKQQNERVATLVITALYSYIKGEKIGLSLLPVTITEQPKRMNIFLLIDETKRNKEIKKTILNFLDGIPTGMLSVYIKGILRYIYGSCIYQTEATTAFVEAPVIQLAVPQTSTDIAPEEDATQDTSGDASDVDDIFDLLESLL